MKKLGFLMLTLAIALMLGGTALAQNPITEDSPYFTTYYSNANTTGAPDETVRIINGGATGNNLYADIYVFDDSEELQECCSCQVTPDGLLSESVNKNLTANPITGIKPTRGVIKVISDPDGDPSNPGNQTGLRVWGTHIQGTKVTLSPGNPIVPVVTGPYFVTGTLAADSSLSEGEDFLLANLCYYAGVLGSGTASCTCTAEDNDF